MNGFMIQQICARRNMLQAMRKVQQNNGCAGVDRLPVDDLPELLAIDQENLIDHVLSGNYLPQPILGVEIPKEKGKKRLLGIPTATDRLLQQAVLQVIQARFEVEFSEYSYGFRPNKNLHQAVLRSQSYINDGYRSIVDIDLKSFFDEVDHKHLLQLVYHKVKCKETMRLIRKWLRAPILIDGKLQKRRKGVPQGSPISPLLSNIMLHELDMFLEKKKIRFVRYADDFSLYTKTEQAAKHLGNKVHKFLRDKLKLSINKGKSGIRKPSNLIILGFEFVPTYKSGDKGQYQIVVAKKSIRALKCKLKSVTKKTTPMSFKERVHKLMEIQRGWVYNYRMASMQQKLLELDGWVRNRLRYCIWHHWKNPEKIRRSFIRLGIAPGQAYQWSRTRMGGWAVAQSPILGTTITVDSMRKKGYIPMLELYSKTSPRLNEPPCTRPVCTVV